MVITTKSVPEVAAIVYIPSKLGNFDFETGSSIRRRCAAGLTCGAQGGERDSPLVFLFLLPDFVNIAVNRSCHSVEGTVERELTVLHVIY